MIRSIFTYKGKISTYKGDRIISKLIDTSQPAPGMVIWHKADAATASTDENDKNTIITAGSQQYIRRMWDFSGNGFHGVTSSSPSATGYLYSPTKSQNGKPGLIRTSIYTGLSMTYATSSSLHTTFTVVTTKSSTTSGSTFIPVLNQGGSFSDRNVEFSIFRDSSDTSKSVIGISPNGSFGTIYTRDGLTASNTFMAKAICKKLSTSFLDPGEFEVSVSGMSTNGSFGDTVTDPSRYGGDTATGDHAFHEFIHYNRVLTEAEMIQTEGYLKEKWGMTF